MKGYKIIILSFAALILSKIIISILRQKAKSTYPIYIKCFINFKLKQIIPPFFLLVYLISTTVTIVNTTKYSPQCVGFCQQFVASVPFDKQRQPSPVILRSPLISAISLILFTSILINFYKLIISKPSFMPKQDNVSIHSGACEICQLNGYPHVYHGSYGCVYQYDHTCPWVASDIGNSNKIPFFYYCIVIIFIIWNNHDFLFYVCHSYLLVAFLNISVT